MTTSKRPFILCRFTKIYILACYQKICLFHHLDQPEDTIFTHLYENLIAKIQILIFHHLNRVLDLVLHLHQILLKKYDLILVCYQNICLFHYLDKVFSHKLKFLNVSKKMLLFTKCSFCHQDQVGEHMIPLPHHLLKI